MSIGKSYIESWIFIKNSKKFILVASLIFIVFAIIGFLFPAFFRNEILQFVEETTKRIDEMNLTGLISFIILNNAKASLLSVVLGIFLCIFPVIIALSNGYLIGFVARYAVNQQGAFILWKLFPHGIFELPAVIISLGIGIKLGVDILKKRKEFGKEFILALKTFILIILPLLIIAGIIEGTLIYFLR